jgi:hypothetical protein
MDINLKLKDKSKLLSDHNARLLRVKDAKWFVENYHKFTQLSHQFIDNKERSILLWKDGHGVFAIVRDNNDNFWKINTENIYNGLNKNESVSILQLRLEADSKKYWELKIMGDNLYIYQAINSNGWREFISQDDKEDKANNTFHLLGASSLIKAMEILYLRGFRAKQGFLIAIVDKYTRQMIRTLTTNYEYISYILSNDGNGIRAVSLYDRNGNNKYGIDFYHPDDPSKTIFHFNFSDENNPSIDIRVGK